MHFHQNSLRKISFHVSAIQYFLYITTVLSLFGKLSVTFRKLFIQYVTYPFKKIRTLSNCHKLYFILWLASLQYLNLSHFNRPISLGYPVLKGDHLRSSSRGQGVAISVLRQSKGKKEGRGLSEKVMKQNDAENVPLASLGAGPPLALFLGCRKD